ncbi:hypothetical protein H6P81_011072 [Aristolochia fimbriata]|uniref:WD repeat-containing protein 75 second beta-propeller domain-containing protein n=1 Tax=Aristolochia fimbriata TaxID=158543 RepID=A0AAV7ETZ4_ARIFI|nr:hypothetical protein H6P81_011072 [Aristolochia fimbriata]
MVSGGKSFVSSPPAFSNDTKKLLICTGNTVSIFSISTGMLIFELEGHTDLVTSVIVVSSAGSASNIICNCWTSSLDGTICYWDFSLPALIKKVEVKLPIFSMVIPRLSSLSVKSDSTLPNHYAFISTEDVKKPNDKDKDWRGQIRMVDLNKSRLVGGPLAETLKPEILAVSSSGEFFGIQNKRKLHIWKVPCKDYKYDEVKKIKLHHTKNFTTLAFHPTEMVVAGGDVTGRILLWRGVGKKTFSEKVTLKLENEEDRPGVRGDDDADSCSTWHWHPSEVKFLRFSSDGAYLYSGGKEGVLVVWQLDTGLKKFLPRIGSPLLYFVDSPDPTLSSVSCADNQIHLLKMPRMEVMKSIAGIKPPCRFPQIYECLHQGFVFNKAAGLVALPTETYCIQFYSLVDDREVAEVQICERNYQPVDDVTVVLTLSALSIDGSRMSTVELKLPEDGIGGMVTLKFWDYEPDNRHFILSTVIYDPHSEARISALAFHPSQNMAVSSSYGGNFKIWVNRSDIQHQMLKKDGWRCQSVGSYKKRPMTAAEFSTDGSVLAVAAEVVVTLWDPDKNVLLAVVGETIMPNIKLSFVGRSQYLVAVSCGSNAQLSVWDLSNLSIIWSYKLLAEAVACTTDSAHFAVLAVIPTLSKQSSLDEFMLRGLDGVILLFSADNPVPISMWSVKKAKGGGLAFLDPSLSFASDREAHSQMLVYINGDHEYVIFDPFNMEANETSKIHREGNLLFEEESGQFGYTSVYGELPKFNAKTDLASSLTFVPSDKPWETIFSGPSHVLPPLSKLCSTFLASLLEKIPNE